MAEPSNTAAAELLIADTVLPVQFWDRRPHGADPERRLMAAVLEDAVALCVRTVSLRNAALAREAEEADEWMASDDRVGPFSFASICDALDLDPQGVRDAINRLRRAHARFVRPRTSAGRGRHQIRQRRQRTSSAA